MFFGASGFLPAGLTQDARPGTGGGASYDLFLFLWLLTKPLRPGYKEIRAAWNESKDSHSDIELYLLGTPDKYHLRRDEIRPNTNDVAVRYK